MNRYNDPASPTVVDALTRRCRQCKSEVGVYCTNHPISAGPLAGRLVHFERCAA